VLRRHAQAFLSQAFAYRWWDGRFAGTVKPEGTDRMSTLDEREEVSGSRRLRRSPQPGKKGQRRAGPAVKQLVEHAPMLIVHPADDSSMTDTLRMGTRLLQRKFQHPRRRSEDLPAGRRSPGESLGG